MHKNAELGPDFRDSKCFCQDAHDRADLALYCSLYVGHILPFLMKNHQDKL
jgi:hypothetical protein